MAAPSPPHDARAPHDDRKGRHHRRELKPVILSEAKDLSLGRAPILRFAQDDSSAGVNAYGGKPSHY